MNDSKQPGQQPALPPDFPLDYGKVFLFDELEFRAYGQLVEANQKKDPFLALGYSNKMQDALSQAVVKRNALFSRESIGASFNIIKQIFNTGEYGRNLAYLLEHFGINPHK